jgi:predicted Ser/Thr protein kinase
LLAACSNTAFRFGRLLGSGKTGYVMEGQYKGVKVAVKVRWDEVPILHQAVLMLRRGTWSLKWVCNP